MVGLVCYRLVIAVAALLLVACSSDSADKQSANPGEISCLIEKRAQDTACWGVVIRPEKGRFNSTISSGQLSVVDSKYARDLSDLMDWIVSSDGAQLTVWFKQGLGGFGSGNAVKVTISKDAFQQPPPGLPIRRSGTRKPIFDNEDAWKC